MIIMLVIDRGGSSQDVKVWKSDYRFVFVRCFCLSMVNNVRNQSVNQSID